MFMTTPDQEYILSILNTTKAMRKLQAALLLKKLDSGKTEQYVDHCLGQLRHIRKIALIKELLTLPHLYNAVPDEDMLAAVDIMLDLTDKKVLAVTASAPPYKLCFLSEQKNGIGNYAIAVVHPGLEPIITASLLNSAHENRTVIFLLSELSQAERIKTTMPHFFAVPDSGKLRYLSGNT